MADDISRRLRLSNDERERIVWLVDKHQVLADAKAMRPSKLKVLLGDERIRELLDLHRADALASEHSLDHVEYCEFLLGLWPDDVLNPEPLITGHDLTRLGYKPGPQFKVWLDAVREAQLDGTISTREEALALIERLRAEAGED